VVAEASTAGIGRLFQKSERRGLYLPLNAAERAGDGPARDGLGAGRPERQRSHVRIVSGAPEKQVPRVPGLWRIDLSDGLLGTLGKPQHLSRRIFRN
jgi:hypothetical protein